MSDKTVRQNTGFIQAESQRAREDMQRAREFGAAGNVRQEKAFTTRADTRMERVNKAAQTIMDRTGRK